MAERSLLAIANLMLIIVNSNFIIFFTRKNYSALNLNIKAYLKLQKHVFFIFLGLATFLA